MAAVAKNNTPQADVPCPAATASGLYRRQWQRSQHRCRAVMPTAAAGPGSGMAAATAVAARGWHHVGRTICSRLSGRGPRAPTGAAPAEEPGAYRGASRGIDSSGGGRHGRALQTAVAVGRSREAVKLCKRVDGGADARDKGCPGGPVGRAARSGGLGDCQRRDRDPSAATGTAPATAYSHGAAEGSNGGSLGGSQGRAAETAVAVGEKGEAVKLCQGGNGGAQARDSSCPEGVSGRAARSGGLGGRQRSSWGSSAATGTAPATTCSRSAAGGINGGSHCGRNAKAAETPVDLGTKKGAV